MNGIIEKSKNAEGADPLEIIAVNVLLNFYVIENVASGASAST